MKSIFAFIFLIHAVNACYIEEARFTCEDGFTLFNRTPTARNSQTAQWCLKAILYRSDINPNGMNISCAKDHNSVISNFENQDERDFILTKAKADFATLIAPNPTHGFSLVVDGTLRPECYTGQPKANDPECGANGFDRTDPHTDMDAFATLNWGKFNNTNFPDAIPYEYDGVIQQETRMSIMVGDGTEENMQFDGSYNDIFENYRSLYDGGEIWKPYGVVCGTNAIKNVVKVWIGEDGKPEQPQPVNP